MNKADLRKLVIEAVRQGIRENLGAPVPVTDDLLDSATELLMLVTGRIMAAKDHPVDARVLQQAIDNLEQVDGLLAKAGLEAGGADISGFAEALKRRSRNQ